MKDIQEELVKVDCLLSNYGIENILDKTRQFMQQDPNLYVTESKNLPEYKYRVKHVIIAMSYITLDFWEKNNNYKKSTSEIFEPLIKILNS